MMRTRLYRPVALAGLLALGGCSAFSTPVPPPFTEPAAAAKPVEYRVKSDGACLQLGELQQPSTSPDAFETRVGALLATGKYESARRLALRFPDVCLDVLRAGHVGEKDAQVYRFLATVCDQYERGDTAPVWAEEISRAGQNPEQHALYLRSREEFRVHPTGLRETSGAHATAERAATPLQQVDANWLSAEALLVAGKPKEAADTLGVALSLSPQPSLYGTAHLLLVLSEADRRSGHKDDAAQAWRRAVEFGAVALAKQPPVLDPGFWERASYLKPNDAAWPEQVVAVWSALARDRCVLPDRVLPADGWLWVMIGAARLDRGEPHAALAALKRAESYGKTADVRTGLAVLQAKVLDQLGQHQAAMTLLVPLAGKADTPASAAATALLGSMRLAGGGAEQAVALLRAAVENPALPAWAGRVDAQADLALAYLSLGRETEGLAALQQARTAYEAAGKLDDVIQTWNNQSKYYEHTARAAQAQEAKSRASQLEAGK